MTLKNSFWASLKENNKRRIWVWLISALGFLIMFPAATAMSISSTMRSAEYYKEAYGAVLGQEKIQDLLFYRMRQLFGVGNSVMWFCIAALAVVSAIQGFSYLYNRSKIDFYLGMPVKRKKRFFVIWLNGIIVYLIPYCIGLIVSGFIAAANGAINGIIIKEMLLAYGMYLCFYLGVYHLAILAVMLTGNVIITCFGVGVFFLYELLVRMTIQGYKQLFFKFYTSYGESTSPLLSPFSILFHFTNAHLQGTGKGFLTAFYLVIFAAAVGIAAYVCYLKRPAEAAGKAMAFQLPKPWIKILISVPAALMAGLMISDIVGYAPVYGEGSTGFVFFAMAVVVIVCSCLIQVIYEFDIKGILHKKRHILISAAAVAVIFAIFRYDVFGYDTYIPDADKVTSAAFASANEYSYYGNSYFNEDMEMISKFEYVDEYMYLTDVGAVNKLMKLSIDAVNEKGDLDMLYQEENEDEDWQQVIMIFRLDNKRKVCRKIYVDIEDPEIIELLDRIEASQEFICGADLGASDTLTQALEDDTNKISAQYGNIIYQQKIDKKEAAELLTLYKEDIKNNKFSTLRSEVPVGSLVITVEKEYPSYNYSTVNQTEMKIYSFYTGCVQYLKEHGYYMEGYLNPEDVERIQITNYNYDAEKEMTESERQYLAQAGPEARLATGAAGAESIYDSTDLDLRKYATYEKEEEIRSISEYLYPREILYPSWHMAKSCDNNYVITVYFKAGSSAARDYGNVAEYGFVQGEIPEFVRKDTEYTK